VEYLRDALDQSAASAAGIQHVYGPTLVYNRAALEAYTGTHSLFHPTENHDEWADEQLGLLAKYAYFTSIVPQFYPQFTPNLPLIYP